MGYIHVEYRESLARAVACLVREGWTPKSAAKFAESGNVEDLEHTGYVSVQLFRPTPRDELR